MFGSLTDIAISSIRHSVHSKRLQETVGELDRLPILSGGVTSAFAKQSEYFQIEISNDASLLKGSKVNFAEIESRGFQFVITLDETLPGLVSAWKLGTLSATTTIRFKLYNTHEKKIINKGSFTGWSFEVHEFDQAVANRDVFIKEYQDAVTAALKSIHGQLSREGYLHTMANSVGLGDKVPDLGYFLNLYSSKFTCEFKVPNHWRKVSLQSKYSTVIEPKNEDRANFGIRIDIDLLIEELGQNVSDTESYINISSNRLMQAGFLLNDTISNPLSLTLKNSKYLMAVRPTKSGQDLVIYSKLGDEFMAVFTVVCLEDYEKFITKYKSDIEYAINNFSFKQTP